MKECACKLDFWPYMLGSCRRAFFIVLGEEFSVKIGTKNQINSIIGKISVSTHTFIMHAAISYYSHK